MKMVETYNRSDAATQEATEQSLLLPPHDSENNATPSNGEDAQGGIPVLQEPTNREIALTMSCIWVCLLPFRFFDMF
jgi:hypothetical protein